MRGMLAGWRERIPVDARVVAIVVGFACYNVWVESVSSCVGLFAGIDAARVSAEAASFRILYCVMAGAASFAVCRWSERAYRLLVQSNGGRAVVACALAIAAPAAALVGSSGGVAPLAAAAAVTGCSCVLFAYWIVVLGTLPLSVLFPCAAMAFCAGMFVPAFAPADASWGYVLGCSLWAVLSFFLMVYADGGKRDGAAGRKDPLRFLSFDAKGAQASRTQTRRVVARLALCLFVWMFALRGVRSALEVSGLEGLGVPLGMDAGAAVALSLVFFAVVLLLFTFPSRFKFEWVYRFLFLLSMVAVLGALPALGAFVPRWFVGTLDFSALQLFAMVMWSVQAALSTNKAVSPARMVTFCSGAWSLGSAGGLVFQQAFGGSGPDVLSLAVACLALLLAFCYTAVFTEHDVALLTTAIPEMRNRPFKERCRVVAKRHRLTERELEIMVLVAMGRDTPRIQEELCLSKNTVNFHRKNLYAKLGIHSKQELLDLVDA